MVECETDFESSDDELFFFFISTLSATHPSFRNIKKTERGNNTRAPSQYVEIESLMN